VLYGATAVAAGFAAEMDHSQHQHRAAGPKQPVLQRSLVDYVLPQVKLVRADGQRVQFPNDIDDGKPVFVNFIYTTCTSICPVMTHSFAEFQDSLGADRDKVRMVSISIDPEQDTPKRLSDYARKYKAGRQWVFYTGTVEASVEVQKAFAVYRSDKMYHTPLTLVRAAPGKPWLRLDGFATPDQLVQEYRRIAAP
jgi:protein SCO1/2